MPSTLSEIPPRTRRLNQPQTKVEPKYSAVSKSKKNPQEQFQHPAQSLGALGRTGAVCCRPQGSPCLLRSLGKQLLNTQEFIPALKHMQHVLLQNCTAMQKYLLALNILAVFGSADLGPLCCIMISEYFINKPIHYWHSEPISCRCKFLLRKLLHFLHTGR